MKFKRKRAIETNPSNDLEVLNQLCNGKTAEELKAMADVVLNWRIKVREESEMVARTQYLPGDKVSFHTKHGLSVTGVVKTANRRTLSLHQCSDGGSWKVAYCFVTKVKADKVDSTSSTHGCQSKPLW